MLFGHACEKRDFAQASAWLDRLGLRAGLKKVVRRKRADLKACWCAFSGVFTINKHVSSSRIGIHPNG